MRVLLTTRGSAGHVLPLAPFGQACLQAGHDVLVVAQRQNRHHVERTGLPFASVDDPPDHLWMPLMAEFSRAGIDEANERMVGEFFARIDTTAALPGLDRIVQDWRPEIIVRETCEYASTVVADRYGIPLVRVGLGPATMEELSIRLAAAGTDAARASVGLAADPEGDRLRATPYFTVVPEALEDPAAPTPRRTHRFRHTAPGDAPPPPNWWNGNDDPLVYVTFGSVAAAPHLPYFPALYRAAIDAIAPLPVRVLVTVGTGGDPAALGELPPNVHVERWVPQEAVLPHAAVAVGHGGYGSTLGALAYGVPSVVVPLFSADQWLNAAAVARSGAGVALDAERRTRRVLDLPGPATLDALGPAVARTVEDPSAAQAAQHVAAAMAALPPVEAAVEILAAIRDGT